MGVMDSRGGDADNLWLIIISPTLPQVSPRFEPGPFQLHYTTNRAPRDGEVIIRPGDDRVVERVELH